jgi:hypothetical protein
LDELGKGNESGWFFENLLPICSDDNDEIEDSRKSGQPLRKSDNLFPPSLLAKSLVFYENGEFLRAYGCARLGCFLAWAPGRPGSKVAEADPNPTIELAANCLLYLRLVDPQYAVNLAVDTLDRSVIRRLENPSIETSVTDLTLFLLAVAAGAFHRDYGHHVFTTEYFDIAEKYAEFLYRPGSKADAYVRFQNHKLINEVGRLEKGRMTKANTIQTRRTLQDTEYGQALGGRMNIFSFRTDPRVYATQPKSSLRVTWFGHSSMLLEIDGVRLLIDPVWDKRAAPTRWVGPSRFFAPTLLLEEMPAIDAVLVSHDHYDHLGKATIQRLSTLESFARAQWVTSLGVGKLLERFGVAAERIVELDWTQDAVLARGARRRLGLVGRIRGDRRSVWAV